MECFEKRGGNIANHQRQKQFVARFPPGHYNPESRLTTTGQLLKNRKRSKPQRIIRRPV